MKFYDSNRLTITIGAVLVDKGFADGEILSIAWDTPGFEDVAGTDGEVSRSKTNDKRATLTLRLMQTAEANAALSTLYNLDLATDNGGGVGPLLVADEGGNTLYAAESCWLQKMPDASFDRTPKEREWTIRVAKLNGFEGGN